MVMWRNMCDYKKVAAAFENNKIEENIFTKEFHDRQDNSIKLKISFQIETSKVESFYYSQTPV